MSQLHHFEKRSLFAAPADMVFNWHLRPGAFERLNPPWEQARILSRSGGITDGGRVTLSVPVMGPIRKTWISEHQGYIPGVQFQDRQIQGPFAALLHTHHVEADGPERCYLSDRMEFRLPFGPLGAIGRSFVLQKLQRVFDYRHRLMAADMAALLAVPPGVGSMRILVVGSLLQARKHPTSVIGSYGVTFFSSSTLRKDSNDIESWLRCKNSFRDIFASNCTSLGNIFLIHPT